MTPPVSIGRAFHWKVNGGRPAQSSRGDQAGSDAKPWVGIACSLRPVRSIEKSLGPPPPGALRAWARAAHP